MRPIFFFFAKKKKNMFKKKSFFLIASLSTTLRNRKQNCVRKTNKIICVQQTWLDPTHQHRATHLFVLIFFWGTYFSKKLKHYKLQNQNKDKKSHGWGNSLRNKVRGWVELDSPEFQSNSFRRCYCVPGVNRNTNCLSHAIELRRYEIVPASLLNRKYCKQWYFRRKYAKRTICRGCLNLHARWSIFLSNNRRQTDKKKSIACQNIRPSSKTGEENSNTDRTHFVFDRKPRNMKDQKTNFNFQVKAGIWTIKYSKENP